MAKQGKSLWSILTTDLSSASPKRSGAYRGPWFLRPQLRRMALLEVTNLLATFTKTNYPLVEGLHRAALESQRSKLRPSLEALAQSMSVGFTLWEAMAAQRRFFPPYYVNIVRAAETTGALPDALLELTRLLRDDSNHASRLATAIGYLLFELIGATSLVLFIGTFIFPRFAEIATDFSTQMPPITQFLFFGAGNPNAGIDWWLVPLPIGSVVVLWVFLRRVEVFRTLATRIALTLPFLRRATQQANLGHSSMVLAHLLRARIPLDEAITSVAEGSTNSYYRTRLRRVAERVAQGLSFGQALGQESSIPASYTAQIRIAEAAEDLPTTLESLGQRYRTYGHQRRYFLVEVAIPVFTLLLGAVVLSIELAVFGMLVALFDSLGVPV